MPLSRSACSTPSSSPSTNSPQQPEYPTRHPELREARLLPVHSFPNYLVFYRIEADAVRILYIVHGVRHLPH